MTLAITHAPVDWVMAALILFALRCLVVIGLGRAAKRGDAPSPQTFRVVDASQFAKGDTITIGPRTMSGWAALDDARYQDDSDIDLPLPRNRSGVTVRGIEP